MEESNERKDVLKKQFVESARASAVRQATVEIINENREEILKRARAKLVASGMPEDVLGEQDE